MRLITTLTQPLARLARSPIVQLIVVVGIILLFRSAPADTSLGSIYAFYNYIVKSSILLIYRQDELDRDLFMFGGISLVLMIAYVYATLYFLVYVARKLWKKLMNLMGRHNVLGMQDLLARSRAIHAYEAWADYMAIKPPNLGEQEWEELYAWPPSGKPPPIAWKQVILDIIVSVVGIALVIATIEWVIGLPILEGIARLWKVL